jgi:hypothetical protein
MLVSCTGGGDATSDAGTSSKETTIGNYDGGTFVVRSTSAVHTPSYVYVALTTLTGSECKKISPGHTAIGLYVFPRDGSLLPGTYDVAGPDGGLSAFTSVVIHQYGASCAEEWGIGDGTRGTITLRSIEPRVTGSFDVVLGNTPLAGSFDTAPCRDDKAWSVGDLSTCE